MSNPRSAQEHGQWLPNRMFDSAANPFAVQNLLRKEAEKFSDTAQARARANFVADSTGREHADALARAFKPDRHGKPEPEAEPMPQAVAQEQADVLQNEAEATPDIEVAVAMEAEDIQAEAQLQEAESVPEPESVLEPEPEPEPVVQQAAPVKSAAKAAPVATAPGLSEETINELMNAARADGRIEALAEAGEEARQQGFEAGYAQAKAELQKEQETQLAALKTLNEGVQALANDSDALFEPVQKLALHLAEQLVRGELAQSGQAISRLVDNALREMAGAGDKVVVVHLNPEDLELYRPLVAQMGESMTLRSNTGLKRGSVRVSLDGSVVEDVIERRLQGLAKSLAQPATAAWRNGPGTSLASRISKDSAVEDVMPNEIVSDDHA